MHDLALFIFCTLSLGTAFIFRGQVTPDMMLLYVAGSCLFWIGYYVREVADRHTKSIEMRGE